MRTSLCSAFFVGVKYKLSRSVYYFSIKRQNRFYSLSKKMILA